jgi:hypothetical protein
MKRLIKPKHQQNKNTRKILSPIKSGYVQHASPIRLYSNHSQCIAVYEEGGVQSSNIEVCQ